MQSVLSKQNHNTADPMTKNSSISKSQLEKAYRIMVTAMKMAEIYEHNAKFTSKYVHATSRGHEAVQIALGLQLKPQDFLSAYYRDDSILPGVLPEIHAQSPLEAGRTEKE